MFGDDNFVKMIILPVEERVYKRANCLRTRRTIRNFWTMNVTSEEDPHSPYFLIAENPTLFILTLGGILFNFLSFCSNFSIVLIILKNVRSMWNRFYFFILFMCFWETIGRCQTAVFQTFRLHALCTDARALFMGRWTCLAFLGCSYVSDISFNVVLLIFAFERFRMQYDPLAYNISMKKRTFFATIFVTVGAILYVVGPP
uniref:G-protein coupled receptors family 1 profile domain-containing protein n=1 Tax=Romanomermis culicivorax TaxID=13658 RepID=A0A915IRR4_ROMCU